MALNYPPDPEADVYLITDTWTSSSLRPHRSLVLRVESQERDHAITFLVPIADDGYQLNWACCRGWVSLIQSDRMSRTGISDEQRQTLLDIALVFLGFANRHPDLQQQDLYLLSGALVEAATELGQFERADDHLRDIASRARTTFPLSVFEDVEIPTVGEGLSPSDLMEIYGRERENLQDDRDVFVRQATGVLARRLTSASVERVMSESRVTLARTAAGGWERLSEGTEVVVTAADEEDYV